MTPRKTAAKGKVVARRPRITAAEIRRREVTQSARENIAQMDDYELASEVQKIAIKQPGILEYEVLMAAARRLDEPASVAPKVPFPALGSPKFPPVGVGQAATPELGITVFNSPTADTTSGEDGVA